VSEAKEKGVRILGQDLNPSAIINHNGYVVFWTKGRLQQSLIKVCPIVDTSKRSRPAIEGNRLSPETSHTPVDLAIGLHQEPRAGNMTTEGFMMRRKFP
jgi:hypothetical protein